MDEPPPADTNDATRTDALQLTWLGHGSVTLTLGSTTLVVDPLLRTHFKGLRRPTPVNVELARQAELVLITHAHSDHLDLPSLRMLGRGVTIVAPTGADRHARRVGGAVVHNVAPGVRVVHGDVDVEVVRAAHSGGRLRAQHGDEAVGYVVRAPDMPSVYVAGDTAFFDEMRDIGPVDVAVLPIGGWWRTLGEGHMDPEGAVEAAVAVQARVLVPVHWGTFHPTFLYNAMRASWALTVDQLERAVAEHAPDLDLRLLQPGDALHLGAID